VRRASARGARARQVAAAAAALLLAAPLLLVAGCRRSAGADETPAVRAARMFETAWGPERPDVLAKYLEVRRALKPVFERNAEAATQWALREASTRPMLLPAMFGVAQLRRTLDESLARTGLGSDDYMRLPLLVYGRWLRADRDEDPPETRVLRTLQEVALGSERHLRAHPPADPVERGKLAERFEAARFQARYVAPIAAMDRAATLARIDRPTAQWLEAHRKEIEELDFGLFDTAAPPRDRPQKKTAPAA
jgi:hypothetical protein